MITDDLLKREMILELQRERLRQIEKGYVVDWDDTKSPENWCNDIEAYVIWARHMYRMRSPDRYRRRMKQIAVLAIAACESYDRNEERLRDLRLAETGEEKK